MNLIEEKISKMNHIEFERFGYKLMDFITDNPSLKHRGLNKDNEPVGHTADSYSDNGEIVGEYSGEKDYFTNFKKPEKDIEHAKKCHPQVKIIYLFSKMEATASGGGNFANFVKTQENKYNIEIKWYDLRGIVDYIEKILVNKPLKLNQLSEFIPEISEIFSSKINRTELQPIPENYYYDTEESFNKLIDKKSLYISGVSGIGKTLLACKLEQELDKSNLIDDIFFIDFTNIESCDKLRTVNINETHNVNLLTLIYASEKTLFILDNISSDEDNIFKQLTERLNNTSYIIFTSQIESSFATQNGFGIECEFPSNIYAEKILNYEISEDDKCPKILLEKILQSTSNHPLTLELIRKLIIFNEYTWNDIDDLICNISHIETNRHEYLFREILKKHEYILQNELNCLSWLNTKILSYHLLKKIILKNGIKKLQTRSLISVSGNIVKIHDIIFNSIKSLNSDYDSSKFIDSFYDFFKKNSKLKTSIFYNALHLHANLLINNLKNDLNIGEKSYFYLCAFSMDEHNLLNEIDICNYEKIIESEFEVKSFLELIECRYRKSKKVLSSNELYEECQSYIKILDRMLSKQEKNSYLYLNIIHHKGKLYLYLKEISDALMCFEEVIKVNPSAYETILQMERIYNQLNNQEYSLKMLDTIINTFKQNPNNISISVVLAAYEDLYNNFNKPSIREKYFLDDFEIFKKAITSSEATTYDQPYRTLSKISKYYSYSYPEKLIEISNEMSVLTISSIGSNSYFDVAQIYKEFGKANIYNDLNEQSIKFLLLAEEFYNQSILNDNYKVTQRAENYELLKRFKDELTFLREHKFEDDYFWNYRIATAYSENDEPDVAVEHMEKAINIIKNNSKLEKFSASLYAKYASILEKWNSIKYREKIIEFYKIAICFAEKQKNKKYILQLNELLKEFMKKF